MRKLLTVIGVVLAGALASSAAPVSCSVASTSGPLTLDRLLPGGDLSDGCIDQDKIYTNFTYNGDVAPDNVQFKFAFAVIGGQDVHTANFQGPWTTDFELGYTIAVDSASPLRWISGVQLDMTRVGSSGSPEVVQSNTPPGAVNPIIATVGGDGETTMPYNTREIAVAIAGSVNGGGIGQFTSSYTQSEIPEPATYGLIGAGLVALGMVRARRAR